MFQNIYEVKITGKDVKRFIKKLYKNGIFINQVSFHNKDAYLKLDKKNYEKLKKIKTIYKVELIRVYGTIRIINLIKIHSFLIFSFIVSIFYLIILSNIIFKVEVIHDNKKIRDLMYEELGKYEIKKYNFIKSYWEKEKIKDKILEEYKDKLEWIEINRKGTKYEIRVEERIINKIESKKEPNHIIAKKDGIVKKIVSSRGEIIKKIDDYVKKGDILISGFITKGENIKNKVNAEGSVYAEVWYKSSINIPFYYTEEQVTNNSKKVLKLNFLNKHIYLFNFNKYKNFKQNKIISLKNVLLPIELILANERETIVTENLFTKDKAIEEAKKRSDEKIKSSLKNEEKILKSNILQTIEYENYITVIIFYKVYEEISIKRQITQEDIKKFEVNKGYS